MVHPQERLRVPLVCTLPQRGVDSMAQSIKDVLHLPQVYTKRQGPYQPHGVRERLEASGIVRLGLPVCRKTHESLGYRRLQDRGIRGEMLFTAVFKQGIETPEVEVCCLKSVPDIEV